MLTTHMYISMHAHMAVQHCTKLVQIKTNVCVQKVLTFTYSTLIMYPDTQICKSEMRRQIDPHMHARRQTNQFGALLTLEHPDFSHSTSQALPQRCRELRVKGVGTPGLLHRHAGGFQAGMESLLLLDVIFGEVSFTKAPRGRQSCFQPFKD